MKSHLLKLLWLHIKFYKEAATREGFHKNYVLKNFEKFKGKRLGQSLFSREFCDIFENKYLAEHLQSATSEYITAHVV